MSWQLVFTVKYFTIYELNVCGALILVYVIVFSWANGQACAQTMLKVIF